MDTCADSLASDVDRRRAGAGEEIRTLRG
jgi:hypothetical protein